jgi:hypothetical protein
MEGATAAMKRDNHYETAFEAYLRSKRIPYVATNESRRSLMGEESLKSLDFIVSPTGGSCSYLVDVKGRRFPSGSGKQKQYWKNWSTHDDLRSMAHWATLFGPQFNGLFVFAYNIVGDRAPLPPERLFEHRGSLYGFVAIRLDHYACWARTVSVKWNTVSIPTARFRDLAEPIDYLFEKSHRLANFALHATGN